MLVILSAGIAPGIALLSYFYLRDHFEYEPVTFVLKIFLSGAVITFPVMFIQHVMITEHCLQKDWLVSFINSGLLEEFCKWFLVYFLAYQSDEFDEPYDGIVYGASVSLGFATMENILYIFSQGLQTAMWRAFLPVSSHALFGVIMGYYAGKAKFISGNRKRIALAQSLLFPVVLHGVYDQLLFLGQRWMYYVVPFMVFLWVFGLRKVKHASYLSKLFHEKKHKQRSINESA